ncbi:MAG: response regulator transcription factor [Treponema sp.]|nr:response regulator transcription factor [Treponema sp.]
MVRILVVDDQILFRDGLVNLINSQPDMKVAVAIGEARDALAFCEKVSPDLVLMDVLTDPPPQSLEDVAGPTGINVTYNIREQFPGIKVIIMTGLSEISLLEAAKKAGAHGFLYKNIHSDQFIDAIRSIMKGQSTFPDALPPGLPFHCSFSSREIMVLRLFCMGKTRSEVASELGFSEALIKVVVTSLLNKTGFDSILRLAVFLTSSGYILPNVGE